MIKLALEIPTHMLPRWDPKIDLSFVLAHKVLQDQHYADFFNRRGSRRQVILDNSTHEFGHPIPFVDLLKAAKMVRADYVIAPDIVTPDADEAQWKQNMEWLQEAVNIFAPSDHALAGVVNGCNMDLLEQYYDDGTDYLEMLCFTFHEPNRLQWWKHYTDHVQFMDIMRIHLLGMSSVEELKRWVDISNDYDDFDFSFDTSKPLKWGVQLKRLDQMTDVSLRGGAVQSKHVLDMEQFSAEQIECVEENITYLKKLCRGEA